MNHRSPKQCTPGPTHSQARSQIVSASAEKSAAWDTIIVGSSPLLLIEAIYLGRNGRRVLILEDREQLGGTWGHLNGNAGFPYLDVGCHYFDISNRAYEFLRSGIGLDLVPFRPQPQFAYRNFLCPYDNKQLIRVFRDLKQAVRQRSAGPFFRNILRNEYHRPRMYPFMKQFLFPAGGSHELISRLTALAQDANVTIRKPLCVDSIDFDTRRKGVRVGAGDQSFEGKEIVAGAQARIADALRIDPEPAGTLRRVYTHVNLVFRDRGAPTFSYIRWIRHPAVIRMAEVTRQMRYWSDDMDDHRIICIGIRDSYDQCMDDRMKVDELVALLKQHRFVDSSAQCEMSCWSRYPAEFLSDELQNRLQTDYAPMIRLISTTNFSVGVADNLDRWEPAFAPHRAVTAASRSMAP